MASAQTGGSSLRTPIACAMSTVSWSPASRISRANTRFTESAVAWYRSIVPWLNPSAFWGSHGWPFVVQRGSVMGVWAPE